MTKWIKIIQIIVSVLLMVAILFQSRGAGLSSLFGGGDNVYRTKRGAEKVLFIATIILAIIFFSVAIFGLIVKE